MHDPMVGIWRYSALCLGGVTKTYQPVLILFTLGTPSSRHIKPRNVTLVLFMGAIFDLLCIDLSPRTSTQYMLALLSTAFSLRLPNCAAHLRIS